MSSKQQEPLRSAAEPFRISFDNSDYTLTEAALRAAVEPGLYRKRRFDHPKLKLISFEAGVIRYLNQIGNDQFELTIALAANHLDVCCSCAEQVKTICIHSFKVLREMAFPTQQHYLNQFNLGGTYELCQDNPDFFDVQHHDLGLRITVKKEVGNVFSLSRKVKSFNCAGVVEATAETKQTAPAEQLCFFIMGNERYRGRLAYLLLCMGVPTKDNTAIKSFRPFAMAGRWMPDLDLSAHNLTNAQKQLCSLGKQLFTGKVPNYHSLLDLDMQELSHYFDLWKEATQLLQTQPFVYIHPIIFDKYIRRCPYKMDAVRVHVQPTSPELLFTWTDKGTHCELSLQVIASGNKDTNYVKNFFTLSRDKLYLLNSFQDCLLVEWMQRADNRIIVLNEHFHQFKQEYLEPLKQHYTVKEITKASPKKGRY